MSARTICYVCNKSVFAMEGVTVSGSMIHETCFKCVFCNKKLTLSSFGSAVVHGVKGLYCSTHLKQAQSGTLPSNAPPPFVPQTQTEQPRATIHVPPIVSPSPPPPVFPPDDVSEESDEDFSYDSDNSDNLEVNEVNLPRAVHFPDVSYSAFISTDKPIYNKGDKVYVRLVFLESRSLKPHPDAYLSLLHNNLTVESASGIVSTLPATPVSASTIGSYWVIPENLAGGAYFIKFHSAGLPGYLDAEREIEIREFTAQRYKKQVEFTRKGLGPGDTATATLDVKRADGSIPAGAEVTGVATVDGKEIWRDGTTLDATGVCTVSFTLPKTITDGEGTLTLIINDQGDTESIGKTIPILLKKIDVSFYPESGHLVSGLNCTLYFECVTPYGDPADISGELLECTDWTVAEPVNADNLPSTFNVISSLSTTHEGRGKVSFVPRSHTPYFVRVLKPSGITNLIRIDKDNKVITGGGIIHASTAVFPAGAPINLQVQTLRAGTYLVCLSKRDVEVSSVYVDITNPKEIYNVQLTPPANIGDGVLRATLLSPKGIPVAERLVFHHCRENIIVELITNRKQYTPRGKVELIIRTKDKYGKPVNAFVGVTVTDDSVLEMVEKRKQPPRLKEMALLECEVKELNDVAAYLGNNPKAYEATDLLLGVQGWRRFVYFKNAAQMEKYLAKNQTKPVRRLLASDLVHMETAAAIRTPIPSSYIQEEELELEERAKEEKSTKKKKLMKPSAKSFQFSPPPPLPGKGGPPPPPMSMAMAAPSMGRGGAPPMPKASQAQQVSQRVASSSRSVPAPAQAPPVPKVSQSRASNIAQPQEKSRRRVEGKELSIQADMGAPTLSSLVAPEKNKKGKRKPPRRPNQRYAPPPPPSVYAVREYHHKCPPKKKHDHVRSDFTETIYWNAGVNVKGERRLKFQVSESFTSFLIKVDAFNQQNAFGTGTKLIKSTKVFGIESKIPVEVATGDLLKIPVILMNNSPEHLNDVSYSIKGNSAQFSKNEGFERDLAIEPEKRVVKVAEFEVGKQPGLYEITASGVADNGEEDNVKRKIKVAPLGFPYSLYHSGRIKNESKAWTFNIPEGFVPGSIGYNVSFSPNPGAGISASIESLIRRPSGCFEQVGAVLYPSVLALQYFTTHAANPKVLSNGYSYMEEGYQRLKNFESKSGGFEWYGGPIGHEVLTAYGILLFLEIKKVSDIVDEAMFSRSLKWLLSKRTNTGRFSLHSGKYAFSNPPINTANAYILWALTCANVSGLEREIELALSIAVNSEDWYLVALTALVLINVQQTQEASKLLTRLAVNQKKSGYGNVVANDRSKVETIVRNYGEGKDIQATALSVLGWIKMDKDHFRANVASAMEFLYSKQKGTSWDSTQSNTLVLMAMLAYERAYPETSKQNETAITLSLDKTVLLAKTLSPSSTNAFTFPANIFPSLEPGNHTISVELANHDQGGQLSVEISYSALLPNNHPNARVHLNTRLVPLKEKEEGDLVTLTEGEGTTVAVQVTNVTPHPLPMVIAQVRIPGGLEPRFQKLKELVTAGKIDFFEIFGGREVVLYWRGMNEKETIEVAFDVVAVVPGTYTGKASTAYLYYTPEEAFYAPGLKSLIVRSEKVEVPPEPPKVEPLPVVPQDAPELEENTFEDDRETPTPALPPASDNLSDYNYREEEPNPFDLSAFGGGRSYGGFVGY